MSTEKLVNKQKELDAIKWEEGIRLNADPSGKMEYCSYCDKCTECGCAATNREEECNCATAYFAGQPKPAKKARKKK